MATVNRYTKVARNVYQPRTLQELMIAPAYKREKHDNLEASISEYETALAQFSAASPHEKQLQEEQQRLYEDMLAQRDLLNKEGFTKSSKSNFLNFNKKFQHAIGPQGNIGKINAAKADLAQKKAAFYKDGFAKAHSKDTLDKNWSKHVSQWSGYDEKGNITNIDELGASMVFDIQKDVMAAANKIGETQGVSRDNIEIKTIPNPDGKGTSIAYFDKVTGHRLENTEQIESLTNALINDYTNTNTSRGQFAEFTGLTKEDIVEMLNSYMGSITVDKETIQHSATPINMSSYKVPIKKDEYEGTTSAIAEGQRFIAEDIEDLTNKIVQHDNTIKTIENSSAPGSVSTLAQAKKERRKLKRLDIQAENEAKNTPELIKLGEQVDRDLVVFKQKEEQVYEMMADLKFEGEKPTDNERAAYIEEMKSWEPYVTPSGTPESVRLLYDRLSKARQGLDVVETADFDKLFGQEEYTLLNEMTELKKSEDQYEKLKNKLKTNFIQRQGIEKTSFISTSTDTEDKFLFNNLKKVLDSKDFNIEHIEIADNPKWAKVDLYDAGNDSKYREIRAQAKDLIASSTDQEIKFGVNNNGDPVLTITATPKEGGEFNTDWIGDNLNDVTFTGSNRFTAEVPLTRYNNRNIPELTDYAVHLLSSTTLAPSLKRAITKGIMTANISVSTDKKELGDAAIAPNYLGKKANDTLQEQNYYAIDFYQNPNSNNAPIVAYKIGEADKKEILISDIINSDSPEEINNFMANSGVLNLYMDYAQNKSMGQFVEDFHRFLPEKYKEQFFGMNHVSVADHLKISEEYREEDPNGENLNKFYKLITDLPLIMDSTSRIIDIRGAIKN